MAATHGRQVGIVPKHASCPVLHGVRVQQGTYSLRWPIFSDEFFTKRRNFCEPGKPGQPSLLKALDGSGFIFGLVLPPCGCAQGLGPWACWRPCASGSLCALPCGRRDVPCCMFWVGLKTNLFYAILRPLNVKCAQVLVFTSLW